MARARAMPLDAIEDSATIPAGTTKDQFRLMLQNLLKERFHLRLHHETRLRPGYELTVAPGPKIKAVEPSNPGSAAPEDARRTAEAVSWGEFPSLLPGPRTFSMVVGGTIRVKYQEQAMAALAEGLGAMIRMALGTDLSAGLGRVRDKTGLSGVFTFTLSFACEACANSSHLSSPSADIAAGSPAAAASEPSGAPSLFVALEKQLGLRLKKISDVPVDVLVIDNLDKSPTSN